VKDKYAKKMIWNVSETWIQTLNHEKTLYVPGWNVCIGL